MVRETKFLFITKPNDLPELKKNSEVLSFSKHVSYQVRSGRYFQSIHEALSELREIGSL